MASQLIERDMYNGLFHLVHNPNAQGRAPRYVVTGDDVTKPQGVTTILGSTLGKDLVGWAVGCAIEYLSLRLPKINEEDLKEASKEHVRQRNSGASTGTETHKLVEMYLTGDIELSSFLEEATPEAEKAYVAFLEWFEETQPTVINVEEVIYSKKYQYAGTYDCMLEIDGKVYLCDLKTTNASRQAPQGVYPENFLQLGAYALAHEEQRVYEAHNGGTELRKIDGLMVISAKKDGKLDIVTNSDVGLTLKECRDGFKKVVGLNRLTRQVSERLRS